MSEHKNNFADAKVLRSEDVTLNNRQLRMLIGNLEQGDHKIEDLKRLHKVSTKIEEVLGDYATEFEHLSTLVQEAVREHGTDSQEFRDANLVIHRFTTTEGANITSDVILTLAEYDWIKTRWAANTKLVGVRSVREDVLALDDAIQNSKGVKFVGEQKRAWVQGEPAPEPDAIRAVS